MFMILYDFLGIFEVCCFEVHVHFALRTLEVLFLLIVGPWRKFRTEQGTEAAFPGDGVGRRRGESGGKRRGARELPLGGRGRSGGGRSWALHSEGRTTAGLGGGGASPATLGGRSRTEELRWGEAKLVEGSIWGGTGRDGGSTELRRRPAMVAANVASLMVLGNGG